MGVPRDVAAGGLYPVGPFFMMLMIDAGRTAGPGGAHPGSPPMITLSSSDTIPGRCHFAIIWRPVATARTASTAGGFYNRILY